MPKEKEKTTEEEKEEEEADDWIGDEQTDLNILKAQKISNHDVFQSSDLLLAKKACVAKQQTFWLDQHIDLSLPLIVGPMMNESLRKQAESLLSLPPTQRFCAGLLAVKTIPKSHVPQTLVGQRGLCAVCAIDAHTLLGEYEGVWTVDGLTVIVPHDEKADDDDDDDDFETGWGFAADDYSFGSSMVYEGKRRDFTINPSQYGNRKLEYANDPRGSGQLANAGWFAAYRGPEPFVFIKTLRAIAKDEWITIDYGPDYWESRSQIASFAFTRINKVK